MTPEARIDAMEKFLAEKLGYTIPGQPANDDYKLVASLSDVKNAGKYRLAAGPYKVTSGFTLPSGVDLDLTGCSFEYLADKWHTLFTVSNDTIIRGGAYKVGQYNLIASPNQVKNVRFLNPTLLAGSGGAYMVTGGQDIVIDGLIASTWYNYCVYVQGNAKNVTLVNWKVDGGSENESCIRVCGCDNLTIRDCHLFCDLNPIGAKKNVAMRLHEGSNYVIQDVEMRGNFGVGPMGGGDGGRQWGTTTFIGKDGKWYAPKDNADMTRTLAQRAKDLSLRTTKVRIQNVRIIEGKATFNPGAVDVVWNGGEITNSSKSTNPNWPDPNWCFYAYTPEYPEPDHRLPADVVRPAPDVTIHDLRLKGTLSDAKGYPRLGIGNTLNGKAIQ